MTIQHAYDLWQDYENTFCGDYEQAFENPSPKRLLNRSFNQCYREMVCEDLAEAFRLFGEIRQ